MLVRPYSLPPAEKRGKEHGKRKTFCRALFCVKKRMTSSGRYSILSIKEG